MPHTEAIRFEIQGLLRTVPFRPFVLELENGRRVLVEHPENIAFDPGSPQGKKASEEFHVVSGDVRLISTFSKVTGVALQDEEGLVG